MRGRHEVVVNAAESHGGSGRGRWRVVTIVALTMMVLSVSTPAWASVTPPSTDVATRVVIDSYGVDVEIPLEPLRIVTTQDTTLANLLALGVRPIATAINAYSVPEFLGDELDGIENIATPGEPGLNVERLVALEPDLVLALGGPFWQDRCDQLREAVLATFCYAFGYATIEELRTNMTDIGRALGMEVAAQAEVDELDSRLVEMAARVEERGMGARTVSVLRVFNGSFWVTCSGPESALMRELGIARPEGQQDYETCSHELSLENTLDLDAYGIYVYVDADEDDTMAVLEANPLWQQLDAVRNDRVWFVDSGVWNGSSLPAAHGMLDDIDATFLAEP